MVWALAFSSFALLALRNLPSFRQSSEFNKKREESVEESKTHIKKEKKTEKQDLKSKLESIAKEAEKSGEISSGGVGAPPPKGEEDENTWSNWFVSLCSKRKLKDEKQAVLDTEALIARLLDETVIESSD